MRFAGGKKRLTGNRPRVRPTVHAGPIDTAWLMLQVLAQGAGRSPEATSWQDGPMGRSVGRLRHRVRSPTDLPIGPAMMPTTATQAWRFKRPIALGFPLADLGPPAAMGYIGEGA